MRRSNLYVVSFTLATTVFVGGTLAIAAIILKPAQDRSVEWDTKSQILRSVVELSKDADVLAIYEKHIIGLVVDSRGQEVAQDAKGKPVAADRVSVAENYKLPTNERLLPIFKYVRDKAHPDQVEAYVLPVYGNGLWDRIWGFVALDSQLKTIKGISFGHKAETPGLGARIADDPIVRERFKGKHIYDEKGELISVAMVKGEKGAPLDGNHVDGLSGATMTGKGVNRMLKSYLDCYKPYFDRIKPGQPVGSGVSSR